MLTPRQIKALKAVRLETDMALAVGSTHFYKGQLGAGIGWTTLDQLQNAGLIEYQRNGSDRDIAITDLGRQRLGE
jgi:predicted transcriptional regulator